MACSNGLVTAHESTHITAFKSEAPQGSLYKHCSACNDNHGYDYLNAQCKRDHAHEYTNSPAVMAFAKDSSDTDKIIALLDNCPSLDHYEITPAVSPEKAYIWNDEITRELFLTALPEKVLLLSEDKNSFARGDICALQLLQLHGYIRRRQDNC